MNTHPFAETYARARQAAGLTQDQAATLCGVSVRTVKGWEAGNPPHVLTQEGALARLATPTGAAPTPPAAPAALGRPKAGQQTRRPVRPMAKAPTPAKLARPPLFKGSGKLL